MAAVEVKVTPVNRVVEVEVNPTSSPKNIDVLTTAKDTNVIQVSPGGDNIDIDVNKIQNNYEVLITGPNSGTGGLKTPENSVEDYRSSFEADVHIYSGFLFNTIPTIKRYMEGTEEFAQGVTNLSTDWNNRLALTYI